LRFLTILFLAINASQVSAQSTSDVSKQFWVDFNPTWFQSADLEIRGSAGVRKEVENNGWWRLFVSPQVRYYIGNELFLIAGIGSYYTINEIIADRWEIRPFQGVLARWPRIKKAYFEHYLRLEERFDINTANWNTDISLRLRYRMLIIYRFGAFQASRFWRIRAGGEGFITLGGEEGQFREQARASISIDRSLRSEMVIRFEVTWQKENTFIITDKSIDDIYLRFRLYYTWGTLKIVY
jgi:hypothetical protein